MFVLPQYSINESQLTILNVLRFVLRYFNESNQIVLLETSSCRAINYLSLPCQHTVFEQHHAVE